MLFFITNKGEQLIHFCIFHVVWHRRIWQGFCMIHHPQGNGPMMNFQVSSNLSQVHAIHIHFSCSFAQAIWIALLFGFWRVFPLAMHATIPLCACICFARFILAARLMAIWTLIHISILAHSFSHSLAAHLALAFALTHLSFAAHEVF